jgi:hypothetical protein
MMRTTSRLNIVFLLACCPVAIGADQTSNPGSNAGQVAVPAGVPLDVVLDLSVPVKHAGVPVIGHIAEPVFVFDNVAIPAGSQVRGRITRIESMSSKRRALAIANGDFTPLRKAHVSFDTLVLKDGTCVPLQTQVSQGVPNVVHLTAGQHGKKKGRVGSAVEQAQQEVKSSEQEAIKEISAPGKMQRVKARLAAALPYHKQSLTKGTHFTAELKSPVEVDLQPHAPAKLDRLSKKEIPPGSTVHVRLLTGLSSATDHKGAPVKAVVSQPLLSPIIS